MGNDLKTLAKAEKAYKNSKFLNSKHARSIRIQSEYFEPYHRFDDLNINATIVFFGSARTLPKDIALAEYDKTKADFKNKNNPTNEERYNKAKVNLIMSQYYEDSASLARIITEWTLDPVSKKQKYYICSGGGPGIMEAANKGAQIAGGRSIGLNISLPMEQYPNPYITDELNFEFHYFFMRKYWFLYMAKAIIIFPGGFGTLDEMMEVLTLIQTHKVNKKVPIIVYGSDYWNEVINLDAMLKWGTISRKDLELFKFIDTVEEVFEYLKISLPE
jgi:hypothetical protein